MNLLPAYGILSEVYRDGAYLNILLARGVDPFTEELANRVIERHFYFSATIDALSNSPPRPKARLILLMGFAMLSEMRKPFYAVVDASVALAKELNLFETGYINAVLKRFAEGERPVLTGRAKAEAEMNLPIELIDLVRADYPKAYKKILTANSEVRKKHVRLVADATENVLDGIDAEPTGYGYFVSPTPAVQALVQEGRLTFQSLASAHAVAAVAAEQGQKVLDLCAAPGGKSVALAETGAEVTAAELYPHRARLIGQYAARTGARLTVVVNDGTILNDKWIENFDRVLVDAPCSGLGVVSKRKDLFLNRKADDVVALEALQSKLLNTASNYVKPGGLLIYSTCTVLKRENGGVARQFLQRHPEFRLNRLPERFENSGEVQFLPDGKGMDGFYIARFQKE